MTEEYCKCKYSISLKVLVVCHFLFLISYFSFVICHFLFLICHKSYELTEKDLMS